MSVLRVVCDKLKKSQHNGKPVTIVYCGADVRGRASKRFDELLSEVDPSRISPEERPIEPIEYPESPVLLTLADAPPNTQSALAHDYRVLESSLGITLYRFYCNETDFDFDQLIGQEVLVQEAIAD